MARLSTLLVAMCVLAAAVAAAGRELKQEGEGAPGQGQGQDSEPGPPAFVDRQLLLQFKAGVTEEQKTSFLNRGQMKKLERVANHDDAELLLVELPPGLDPTAAHGKLKARDTDTDDVLVFAEPNSIFQHQQQVDSYVSSGALWGMYGDASSPANQYGIGAKEIWATKSDCSAVWVGIVDEGYYYGHEDLVGNVGKNPGEIAGNGKDDDGNGYIDDVYGWDFANNDNTVFDGVGDDHGTHVAGTIGAMGNNGKGVAGVCFSVKIINAKFLGSNGGTLANAVRAIDYMTDLKTRHKINLIAINNSWGGGGYDQSLWNAIERANQAGILMVIAAGNSGVNCDTTSCYPANYNNANVISVAAITSTGAMASFSNWGATTVDIGAPGVGIWSTVPVSSRGKITSGYASYQGTSMATPHVTGAAALYKARNPGANAAQVKDAILAAGTSTASLAGKCVTGRRLNVDSFP